MNRSPSSLFFTCFKGIVMRFPKNVYSNSPSSSFPGFAIPKLPATADETARLFRPNALHYTLFLAIVVAVVMGLFAIVPGAAERFALGNLKPDDVQAVNFGGVYASPTAEGKRFAGNDMRRAYTTAEFILDFTPKERNREFHGYAKAADDWYLKTAFTGEDAIIVSPVLALSFGFTFLGVLIAVLATFVMSPRLGLMAAITERIIAETRTKLLFQTNFSPELLEFLVMSDSDVNVMAAQERTRVTAYLDTLWQACATEQERETLTLAGARFDAASVELGQFARVRAVLIGRIKDAFSPAVASSLYNLIHAYGWQRNRIRFTSGLRLFMTEYFTPRFGNSVQGLAYAGAAVMIVSIGLRGLRFIPASRPSLILATITLEFALLVLLGITLYFQSEEGSSVESLKRIENNTQNVALVLSSVSTEAVQRMIEDSMREYAHSPEVQERMANTLTSTIVDALKSQGQQRVPAVR
jgi:hypothetical protein